MKIELSIGWGFHRSGSVRARRDGVYFYIGRHTALFRRRRSFEVPSAHGPGEGLHWWRPDDFKNRAELSDNIYVPLGKKWCIEFRRKNKDYADLVGYRAPSIDWIIDEFDDSFNDLAVASLRYHMDYSVCYCHPETRAKYEDLIRRLTEPKPRFTKEELATLHPPGWTIQDDLEPLPEGGALLRPASDEKHAVYEARQARDDAWEDRQLQARHDFVDIMRGLWS